MENFLVEWLPESISERSSMTRPRVYIIDFETAVEFPENSLESERICSSLPIPKELYSRPVPPEAENGEPYCPFRMDVWQFGKELQDNFQVSYFLSFSCNVIAKFASLSDWITGGRSIVGGSHLSCARGPAYGNRGYEQAR